MNLDPRIQELTCFNRDGELKQYSLKGVQLGGTTAVALKNYTCAVVASHKRQVGKLTDPKTVKNLYKINKHLGCAMIGSVGDSRCQIQQAKNTVAKWMKSYGYEMPVDVLARNIADINQVYTQCGAIRALACSMLLIGYDDEKGPCVYLTDPAGNYDGVNAMSVGCHEDAANELLILQYSPGRSEDETIQLALHTLQSALTTKFDAKSVEVGIVSQANPCFQQLNESEIEKHLLAMPLAKSTA